MIWLYNGTQLTNKKEKSTDTHTNTNKSQKHVEQKKPETHTQNCTPMMPST